MDKGSHYSQQTTIEIRFMLERVGILKKQDKSGNTSKRL